MFNPATNAPGIGAGSRELRDTSSRDFARRVGTSNTALGWRSGLRDIPQLSQRRSLHAPAQPYRDRCIHYPGAKSFVNNGRRESFLGGGGGGDGASV